MLIVSRGKVVVGYQVIGIGGELDGLSPEAERRLIALGVAKRVGEREAEEPPAGDGATIVPTAKEATKADLQAKCREYGISDKGTKAELLARIDDYERESEEDTEGESDEEPPVLTPEVPR